MHDAGWRVEHELHRRPVDCDTTGLDEDGDEGSGNSMLVRIWPLIESQIQLTMMLDEATRNIPARDRTMHIQLVEAIGSGEPQRIITEVDSHISWSTGDWGEPPRH